MSWTLVLQLLVLMFFGTFFTLIIIKAIKAPM